MLFIDGELVDLDDDSKITLNYKSNLFTDLSKIVSNNSYTIKLPKTVRNQRIIQHADLPACDTDYPRILHDARYFRNGVEVIPKAKAVLISVSDTIEIAITWGNFVSMNDLIQEGISLNDLPVNEDYVQWNSSLAISNYNMNAGVIVSKINFGLKSTETLATYHPSVRVSYILNQIKNKYGLTFNWPDNIQSFLSTLIIPLLTRNGGHANQRDNYGLLDANNVQTSQNGSLVYWTNLEKGPGFSSAFEYVFDTSGTIVRFVKLKVDGTVVLTPNFKSKNNNIVVFYGDTSVMENFRYLPYTVVPGEFPYYYNIPFEVDIQTGSFFTIGLRQGFTQLSGSDTHRMTFDMKPKEIQMGDRFSVIENLPKIKTIDFLKSLCSLCGLFAIPSENEGQISFVSVDTIRNNISKAKDWTRRVVAQTYENKPYEIAYIVDDFARNNRMKYKDDDTVVSSYDGVLVIEDNTIDYERDAVTLPFAASDTRGGIASVPIYSYNTSGELEFSSVESRILIEQDDSGKSKAIFTGLDWPTLINNYYQSYQGIIRKPVIITEKIEISDFDLKSLDVTVPIYLGQYGRYYAIIEIKAENTGICECKLLQLEV